ncbi:MAG TPA: SGNH/GDSL hydrolase family protein [Acidobacteriaceae bacterium]|nr:SGNH/GDSL hydrolase family protein [Acidobacteriaceae bacterium]
MNRLIRLLVAPLLFTATFALAQTAPAAAPTPNPHPYTTLYVFGDSYSDSGSGYVDTNGLTAVAVLAQRLGIPFTYYGDPKYTPGVGLNFAISGARTGEGPGRRYPTGEILGYGMANQVANFVTFSKAGNIPKIDPDNTMFFFAGGLNDRGTQPGYTRNNIEAEIDALYDLGGRRFMVALLPTKIPQFATAGTQFNPELSKIPDEERAKHSDIRISNSDWGPFLDEVITNPSKYGITDTKTPCAGRAFQHKDPTPCADPGTHFFYHEGHPSAAAHKAVGDMLYQEAITKAP